MHIGKKSYTVVEIMSDFFFFPCQSVSFYNASLGVIFSNAYKYPSGMQPGLE